jgi:UDP-N-acetylglucosamine--N-acetylmuramyl-(pentapeptide) pyrophosphoryl-undecaprenol N-acetylglucosamine transferase
LAIARAGAVTLAELAACGIPAILIPYPYAAGDHQRKNAAEMAAKGMARVIDQKDLESVDLLDEAVAFHRSDAFRQMKQAVADGMHRQRAAVDIIAEDVVNLIHEVKKTGC